MKANFDFRTISFTDYEKLFTTSLAGHCHCPFITPLWLRTWYTIFGGSSQPHLISIGLEPQSPGIGIAPLMQSGNTMRFMGDESICDFQDFLLGKHNADGFFTALLFFLQQKNITELELGALTPHSKTLQALPKLCKKVGLKYRLESAGNLSLLRLPSSWEEYLGLLPGKRRHEIRRKLRRVEEAGEISFSETTDSALAHQQFDVFLKMFTESRFDKANFLTPEMHHYFATLMKNLAQKDLLRLGTLSINSQPVAMTFGFIMNSTYYLYNNGFSPNYSYLSIGLLSKVLAIKSAIDHGLHYCNFLKGDEQYKQHLGGKKIGLKRLTVSL